VSDWDRAERELRAMLTARRRRRWLVFGTVALVIRLAVFAASVGVALLIFYVGAPALGEDPSTEGLVALGLLIGAVLGLGLAGATS
jgi:hypothetical protein